MRDARAAPRVWGGDRIAASRTARALPWPGVRISSGVASRDGLPGQAGHRTSPHTLAYGTAGKAGPSRIVCSSEHDGPVPIAADCAGPVLGAVLSSF